MSSIHESNLVVTGNCVIVCGRDDDPPTEVVFSLLRDGKIWVFALKRSSEAAQLSNVKEAKNSEKFHEGVLYKRFRGLTYCVQEVGHTVCLPARTAHMLLSVNENESWNVSMSQKSTSSC